MTGDAESGAAVQDGHFEAGFCRVRRVGVQWVVIAREAIDQRGLRQRRQIADKIRRRIGDRMLRLAGAAGPAEAAVSAAERRRRQRAQRVAALFIAHRAFGKDQGALVLAFVQYTNDFCEANDGAFGRQRFVDSETLFAMHDVAARDAGVAFGVPRSRITHDDGHRRQCLQIRFVDVFQLVLVTRIGAEADAQRV